jgi:MSHA biogenesis protein MshN
MSVLNTMLSDLERRGARSTLTLAPTEADRFAPPAALQDPPKPRVRRVPARPAVLVAAAVATAAAVWLWPSSALRATKSMPEEVSSTKAGPPQVAPVAPPPAIPDTAAASAAVAVPVAPPPTIEAAPTQPMHPHTPTPSFALRASAGKPGDVSSTKAGLPSEASSTKEGVAQSTAQAELRRAIELVARGQTTEATRLLADALSQRPDWSDARATLAALQAEAGDRRQALATLLDGVQFDPTRFAPTAAQLQAELNDPAGALLALDRVPPAARDQSYHALAAAIAQRAGRHQMAVAEYGAALRSVPSNAVAWVGLGVSLQALGHDAEALAAYRGAARETLSAELRRFVQLRISALQASAAP